MFTSSSFSCIGGGFGSGEVLLLLSMLTWTINIAIISVGCRKVNALSLTITDFAIALELSIITALLFETHYFQYPYTAIGRCWWLVICKFNLYLKTLLCISATIMIHWLL